MRSRKVCFPPGLIVSLLHRSNGLMVGRPSDIPTCCHEGLRGATFQASVCPASYCLSLR